MVDLSLRYGLPTELHETTEEVVQGEGLAMLSLLLNEVMNSKTSQDCPACSHSQIKF